MCRTNCGSQHDLGARPFVLCGVVEMRRSGGAKEFIAARIRVEDRGHDTPCWVWQQALTYNGYGRAGIPGFSARRTRVHRATYELYVGPIPEGLTLDHLCRVKSCCNPDHLEPVTALENFRRSLAHRPSAKESECVRGHDASHRNAHGNCKICARETQRAYHARRTAYMRERRAKISEAA